MRAHGTGMHEVQRVSGSRELAGLATAFFAVFCVARAAGAATIVNCIGEQTTITGEGVSGPAQLWPQQLGTMLGATYTVNNDGVNAGTVVAGTAKSAASLVGPPNIVIIGPFAEHDYAATLTLATWQADYKKLVDAYLALTPAPTVYVMTPPPAAFVYQNAAEQTFATTIVKPAVLAVAAGDNSAAKTLKVIDLSSDAALVTAADVVGDGHFSAAGMTEVAQLAYKCLKDGTCGAVPATGAGGAGGGGGAGGAGGATAGTGGGAGSAGSAGTTGAAGTTAPATGTAGTTGAAGTSAPTTGAAGTSAPTTGAAGTSAPTTGAAGTSVSTTGAAGTTASGTGTAGTSGDSRSSGGGCAVAGGTGARGVAAGGLAALALLVARRARRRRR
jgi:MYXO-CTERM domain-containing protein